MSYYPANSGGSMADRLSQDFRAMSTNRDQQWGAPLPYGPTYPGSQSEPVGYRDPFRGSAGPSYYDPSSRQSSGYEELRTERRGSTSMRRSSRDQWERIEEERRRYSASRRAKGFSTSSSSSYSESDSEEDSSSQTSSASSGGAPRDRRQNPSRSLQRRVTPVSAQVRWVPDEETDAQLVPTEPVPFDLPRRGIMRNTQSPQPVAQDRHVMIADPPDMGNPRAGAMPSLVPSTLLRRLVETISYYRRSPPPPFISSEVVMAFDGYVSRGSTMLKFISKGPPHSRYFMIRFLDINAGGPRFHRSRKDGNVSQAVLSWYRTSESRHMNRFLPLRDLVAVYRDGYSHPYVQRRQARPGVLRGPRSGLFTNYIHDDCVFQLHFRSPISGAQETLALKAANRTTYLAWLVVATFISQIGMEGAEVGTCGQEGQPAAMLR